MESWAGRLKEELDTVGLGCIWQNEGEKEMITICHITKTRCSDSHDTGGQLERGKMVCRLYVRTETFLGKRGVFIVLHNEQKKQYSMAWVGSL
jgi:hypothetical protein